MRLFSEKIFLLLLLFLSIASPAQEFNYWTQQNNTENNYLQINLVFGFTYFFPRI